MPSATANGMLRVCSCDFATDDDTWFDGHLSEWTSHNERTLERYVPLAITDRKVEPRCAEPLVWAEQV